MLCLIERKSSLQVAAVTLLQFLVPGKGTGYHPTFVEYQRTRNKLVSNQKPHSFFAHSTIRIPLSASSALISYSIILIFCHVCTFTSSIKSRIPNIVFWNWTTSFTKLVISCISVIPHILQGISQQHHYPLTCNSS